MDRVVSGDQNPMMGGGVSKTSKRTPRSIVVYGTGSIGFRHLQLLTRSKKVKAVAVPVRPERRRELEGAGYSTAVTLEDAWRQGARGCVIATDTGRHLNDALKAFKLGFHTLVEKPLCVDSAQARVLLRAAEKADVQVYTACVLRFSNSLNVLRDHLPQLGKIFSVRIECQSYLPDWRPARDYWNSYSARADEGGVLRDLIHEIDYAGWLFGWPRSLQAKLMNRKRLRIQSEESAELWWTTSGGTSVSIRLDYLTRPTRRGMVVCGEHGTVEWNAVRDTVTCSAVRGNAGTHRIKQDRNDKYERQLKEFQRAIFENKKPHLLSSGEDGFRALAVCDAARLASKFKREEKVRYS